MRLIHTAKYPFKGFNAITHWPIGVFYKKELTRRSINHEGIHWRQQRELLVLPFYLIYVGEYLVNIRKFKKKLKKQFPDKPIKRLRKIWKHKSYRNISFEKEAFSNQANYNYLEKRKIFAMWRQ